MTTTWPANVAPATPRAPPTVAAGDRAAPMSPAPSPTRRTRGRVRGCPGAAVAPARRRDARHRREPRHVLSVSDSRTCASAMPSAMQWCIRTSSAQPSARRPRAGTRARAVWCDRAGPRLGRWTTSCSTARSPGAGKREAVEVRAPRRSRGRLPRPGPGPGRARRHARRKRGKWSATRSRNTSCTAAQSSGSSNHRIELITMRFVGRSMRSRPCVRRCHRVAVRHAATYVLRARWPSRVSRRPRGESTVSRLRGLTLRRQRPGTARRAAAPRS